MEQRACATTEVGGRFGAVDGSLEAVGNKPREVTAVVWVGVGEEYGVESCEVALLVETAVDENAYLVVAGVR